MAAIAFFKSTRMRGGEQMPADRQWVKLNLGFDPVSTPPPPDTYTVESAAKPNSVPEDFQREIIEFDSEAPEGRAFLAFSTATGLSRFTDIPWPRGLAPKTGKKTGRRGSALPRADVLVVTWTVDEGHTLSRVLTPGKDSRNDFVPYTHNYAAFARKMSPRSPARQAKRLGAYWTTTIGKKTVVVLKSDSHLSQDTKQVPSKGQTLPNEDFWKQIIDEVRPKLIITTGTAGGIGKTLEVGDVVVSPNVRFDCQKWLKRAPYHNADYRNSAVQAKYLTQARKLFKANAGQLPKTNRRPPKIVRVSPNGVSSAVVTTDFFGFDTSNNRYKLWHLGTVSEMGDAVLGKVAKEMGSAAPRWAAVRNVSDPQIKADGLSPKQQAQMAAQIYKGFGRWSSVCSAIACWALIAAA
jgi:purine-nucleoside phosphorylase